MLKINEFKKLQYNEKKDLLVEIFWQIQTEETDFHDAIFLIQASDKIGLETLDSVYTDILDLLNTNKDTQQELYKAKLQKIQQQMHEDSEKESLEAEELLDNLDTDLDIIN